MFKITYKFIKFISKRNCISVKYVNLLGAKGVLLLSLTSTVAYYWQ